MAYTAINKSSLNFNTVLYTGNGASTRTVTGVGFKPDLVWGKERSSVGSNNWMDVVRTANNYIQSDTTAAASNDATKLKSFDSNGFTVGDDGSINQNNATYASWNWKAGTAVSGTTTGSGTGKSYSGSVNTTSGFSIIKYLGNGTAGHTIPHRLGEVPKMILVKSLDRATNWMVYHSYLGGTKFLKLNLTTASTTSNAIWYNTSPTSSVFTVGSDGDVNNNNENYIAYVFAEKQGYSKFGSYIGTGNVDGKFIYTGTKPSFVMFKKASSTGNWFMMNNKMFPANGINASGTDQKYLYANTNNNEQGGYGQTDILSNGFKARSSDGDLNGSGVTYVYMSFGQSIVGTNNVPCTAR